MAVGKYGSRISNNSIAIKRGCVSLMQSNESNKRLLMDELADYYGQAFNLPGRAHLIESPTREEVLSNKYQAEFVPTHKIVTPLPQIVRKEVITEPLIVDLAIDPTVYTDYFKRYETIECSNAYQHLVKANIKGIAYEYLDLMNVDDDDPYRELYRMMFMGRIAFYYYGVLAEEGFSRDQYNHGGSTPNSKYKKAYKHAVELLGLMIDEGVTIHRRENSGALVLLLRQLIMENELLFADNDINKLFGIEKDDEFVSRSNIQFNDMLCYRLFVRELCQYLSLVPQRNAHLDLVKRIFVSLCSDNDDRVVETEFQHWERVQYSEKKVVEYKLDVVDYEGMHPLRMFGGPAYKL